MQGYKPLEWATDSTLTAEERETIETQRRDLWRNGVKTEPLLTRMAFEFGAVITMRRAAKRAGVKLR
jgi:hypothetical protein